MGHYVLHQAPPNPLALARAINGDRADSGYRVPHEEKVGADRLAVTESDYTVKILTRHQHPERLLGKVDSGKIE